MSGTPNQNQKVGTAQNYNLHCGNLNFINGGTIHGGINSKVEITNSSQKQNDKQATGGGGVDGKCLDKNDGVAASDGRSGVAASDGRGGIQTTTRATHTGKDDHGALYIPPDLIPVDVKDITLTHVESYFQDYYRYFATDPDVRKSFDENKGYHLDYSATHGEKFKIILTDLHQLIKNEGNKCLGEYVVEGFNEAGFRVKSSTQGPSNVAQCLGIMKSPVAQEICKKDPFFMLRITYKNVHLAGLNNCHFVKTILVDHLKKFGNNHKPKFVFNESVKNAKQSRKRYVCHNIIRIANIGTQQIKKDFQQTEMESFGMSVRTINRQGSQDTDNWLIKLDCSFISVSNNDFCKGKEDAWLLVNKNVVPFKGQPTPAQLHQWLSHTEMTRTAYKLVHFAQQKSISLDDVINEVSIAYSDVKKSQLVGPSKPLVDNFFDICNPEDPGLIDNMLSDIEEAPIHQQHKAPPYISSQQNQHLTQLSTQQCQTQEPISCQQNPTYSSAQYLTPPNNKLLQNTTNGNNLKQPNGTSDNNCTMVTVDRTVKDSTGVENILLQMSKGTEAGKSM